MKKTTSATGGAATFQTSTSTTMGHRVQLTPKQVLEKLGNLQMGFYTKMPADAQCIFTISAHVPVKRWMKHPFKQREIRDWDENQVQIKANLIRKFHPEHLMEKVAPVEKWEQMYDYFDAADIWSHGAVNLWLAIDYLYHENKSIEEAKGKGKEIAKGNVAEAYGQQVGDTMDINPPQLANENPEGFMIADDWAYKWLTHADNRQKLSTWDQKRDILSIFTANDWNNVAPCSYEYLDVLRRILIHWHPFYFAPSPVKDSKEGSTASKNEYQAGHGRDVNKYLVPPSSNAVEQLRCSSALATEFPSAVKNSPASSTGSQSANVSPTLRVAPLAIPIVVTAGQGDLKVYGVEHNTRRHEPSKSGPIDMAQTELAKLQTSVEIAGPSRLPAHPLKNSGPSTLPIPSHTAKVACKFHGNRDRSVSQQSEPCHCPRCDKKSRSVLVQGLSIDGIPQEKYTHQIKGFFGKWGEVESCEPTCPKAHPYRLGGRSLRNFFVYFKSDDSAVRACNEAHGQSLYPLANKLKVVFPYHSRHYIELYSPASKQSHVSLRSATQPAEHMTIDKGTGVSGGETQPSQPQQPKTQNQNQKLRTPPMPSVASNQASGGNSSRKPRQPLSGAFVHPAQYSTGSPRHKNRGTSDGRFLENNARFTSSAAFGGNPFGNPSASSQTSPVYVRMQPQQYAQQLYPSGYQQFAGQHQFSGQPQFYGQSQYTQQPQYGSQGFHGMRMPAGVIPGTLFPSAAQPMAHMPQQQYAGHHPAYWNPSQYGAPSYQPCKQDEQQNPAQNAQPARKFQPYGGPQTGYGQVLAHHPSVVPHQYIPVPSGASTTGMLLDMASHVYITPASAAAPAAPGHDQPLPEQKKEHVAEESSILAEMNNSPEVHVSRKQSSTSELSAIPEKPVATETSVAIENPVTTEESVISSQPVASKGHVTPQDCVSSGGATKEITAPEMHTNPIADIPAQEKKGGVSNTAIPVEEETTEAGASVVHQKTIAALPQILEEPESERTKPATERPKYVFGSQDVRFFTSEAEEGKAIETVIHRKLRVRQSIPSEWMGIDNAGSSGVPPISGSAKTPVAPVPTVVERPELRVNTQVGGTDFGTRSRSSAAVLEQNPSPQVAGPKQPQHEDTQEDGKSKPKKNKSKKKKQQQASGQQSGSRPSTLATLVNSPAGGQPENAVQKTGKHGAADTSAENTAAEGTEGKSQKRYRPRKTDLSTSSVQETAHHVSKELPSAPSTLPPKPEQSNLVQQDHDAGSSLWGQDSNAQLASGRGYRADAGGSLRVDRNRNNNSQSLDINELFAANKAETRVASASVPPMAQPTMATPPEYGYCSPPYGSQYTAMAPPPVQHAGTPPMVRGPPIGYFTQPAAYGPYSGSPQYGQYHPSQQQMGDQQSQSPPSAQVHVPRRTEFSMPPVEYHPTQPTVPRPFTVAEQHQQAPQQRPSLLVDESIVVKPDMPEAPSDKEVPVVKFPASNSPLTRSPKIEASIAEPAAEADNVSVSASLGDFDAPVAQADAFETPGNINTSFTETPCIKNTAAEVPAVAISAACPSAAGSSINSAATVESVVADTAVVDAPVVENLLATVPVEASKATKNTEQEHDWIRHGSFTGLPQNFDPFPRVPTRSSARHPPPPKVVVQKAEPVVQLEDTQDNTLVILSDSQYMVGHKLSGSSVAHTHQTSDSYFSARSHVSSRESSPPVAEDDELMFESPLGTPPRLSPATSVHDGTQLGTPSSATMTLGGRRGSSPTPSCSDLDLSEGRPASPKTPDSLKPAIYRTAATLTTPKHASGTPAPAPNARATASPPYSSMAPAALMAVASDDGSLSSSKAAKPSSPPPVTDDGYSALSSSPASAAAATPKASLPPAPSEPQPKAPAGKNKKKRDNGKKKKNAA